MSWLLLRLVISMHGLNMKLSGVISWRGIAVVLVEYMMKEIQTVNAKLYCSDCDRSYMFRLGTTMKLCTDGFICVIMEVV